MEVVNTRERIQVKNRSSVISVSTHPINLDVGMSISKNKDEILRINGTMKEAKDVVGSVEEKMKKAMKHFEVKDKKLEMILIIFPYKAALL